MSIWSSFGDDRLTDVPDRDDYGEVISDETFLLDVATSPYRTEMIRLIVGDGCAIVTLDELKLFRDNISGAIDRVENYVEPSGEDVTLFGRVVDDEMMAEIQRVGSHAWVMANAPKESE